MSFYVAGTLLFSIALFGSVMGLISRVLMRHGRLLAAARVGTAGFCATVLVTAALAALASMALSPFGGAVALVLAIMAIRDYRFLEKLPQEDPPADQAADGQAAPQDGGK